MGSSNENFNSQPVESQSQSDNGGEQHVAKLFDEMREATQPGRTSVDLQGQEWGTMMGNHLASGVSEFINKHTNSDGKVDLRNASTEDLMKFSAMVSQQLSEFQKVPETIAKKLATAVENHKQFG